MKSKKRQARASDPHDLLYYAWTIICNAGQGDWTKESIEWQQAAANFREKFHATL